LPHHTKFLVCYDDFSAFSITQKEFKLLLSRSKEAEDIVSE